MSGLLTEEQVQQSQLNFVSIDQASGQFTCNKKLYPGIEGDFLGFDSHDYDFKGEPQKKLDIYIAINGGVFQVQFGFYSWLTHGLLNCMSNIPNLSAGGKIKFVANKVDQNYNVKVTWNSKAISWFKTMEELKYGNLKGKDKEAYRDKVINRFFELLDGKHHYNPEEEVPVQEDSEPTSEPVNNGEVPF